MEFNQILREAISMGSGIASIISLLLGFFGGKGFWTKRAIEQLQKQSQEADGIKQDQFQKQEIN